MFLSHSGMCFLQIDIIPSGYFSNNSHLMRLYVSKNHITTIGDIFRPLKRLTELVLSHNKISFVARCAFIGLSALRVLCLDHNYISQIDLSGLSHCLIFLASNEIKNVEDLRGLPRVEFDTYKFELEGGNIGLYSNSDLIFLEMFD